MSVLRLRKSHIQVVPVAAPPVVDLAPLLDRIATLEKILGELVARPVPVEKQYVEKQDKEWTFKIEKDNSGVISRVVASPFGEAKEIEGPSVAERFYGKG